MILGQSIFDAVLARLKEEAEDNADLASENDPPRSIKGFNSSFIAATQNSKPETSAHDALQRLYFAFEADHDDAPVATADTFDPAPFARLSPEEVAEDLGIQNSDTIATLMNRRRHFARLNHPDRIPLAWREQANMRMTLANLLIDEAIKRSKA